MQVAVRIAEAAGELDHEQLDVFLKGNLALEKAARPNPQPDWISDAGWHDVMRLAALRCPEGGRGDAVGAAGSPLRGLADALEADGEAWHAWYELECPEATLPRGFDSRLTPLERLLVLRCLRLDRVTV